MDLGCLAIQLNGISEGDLSLRDAYDRATCGSTMKREARAHHTQRPMERAVFLAALLELPLSDGSSAWGELQRSALLSDPRAFFEALLGGPGPLGRTWVALTSVAVREIPFVLPCSHLI